MSVCHSSFSFESCLDMCLVSRSLGKWEEEITWASNSFRHQFKRVTFAITVYKLWSARNAVRFFKLNIQLLLGLWIPSLIWCRMWSELGTKIPGCKENCGLALRQGPHWISCARFLDGLWTVSCSLVCSCHCLVLIINKNLFFFLKKKRSTRS